MIQSQAVSSYNWIALVFLISSVHVIAIDDKFTVPEDASFQDLLMPGAKPLQHDQYLCSSFPVTEEEEYIFKFEALASADTAHHMLLYGCDGEPYSDKPIWNCPLMCKSGSPTIMFAWAKNAPPTVLPKDVGLRIGQKTTINTIVLQVHYAKKFRKDESPDHSGLRIHTTHQKQPFVAGIFLLLSAWFNIPGNNPSYPVDMSCKYSKDNTMVPFAYRTHAHGLGKIITGYKYLNGKYTEIGKGNPQWPQAFYPVKEKLEIHPGDYLAARCVYDSTSMNHNVRVGSTGDDEMCNFYIMFYTNSSVSSPYGQCFNNEVPSITGDNLPADANVPLPPNPALEDQASGHHHHHGGMGGGSAEEENVDEGGSNTETEPTSAAPHTDVTMKPTVTTNNDQDIGISNLSPKAKPMLKQGLQNLANQKQAILRDETTSRSVPGKEQLNSILGREMFQPSYDFYDVDLRDIPYEKRENHEYYTDYAANDLREKGLYGLPSRDQEPGLSRNRHKEFEAMNQQLQHYGGQKQGPVAPVHLQQQQGQQRPGPAQTLGPNKNRLGQNGALSQQQQQQAISPGSRLNQPPQPHRHVHFQHSLVYNGSWPGHPIQLGQIGGIATDADGRLYIFHRASRIWNPQSFSIDDDFMYQDAPIGDNVLVILERDGKLVHSMFSGQFFMPHGIEVDHEGNAWLTDVALHQVFKIPLKPYLGKTKPSEDPKPTLTLGKRFKHGEDDDLLCKPTDVAVLSSGEFFVSDGYCNARVLKFSKEGNLIKKWGVRNYIKFPPPPGSFNIPHGVTVAEDLKIVCVADREYGRIQCFDLDGNFKRVIKHPEFGPRVFGVEYCPLKGGVLYAINGPGYDGRHAFTVQGFTLDIQTGELLEMWNTPQLLKNPHDICVDAGSQSVYVGELDPSTVWKLSRTDAAPQITADHDEHSHGKEAEEHSVDSAKADKKSSVTDKPLSGAGGNKTPTGDNGNSKNSTDDAVVDKADGELQQAQNMTASMIIGLMLVVPVILLLIIVLVVRYHKAGYFSRKKNKVFSLQGFLGNSHKGFDPLSTEESDHDLDQEDSDHDEYLAPKKFKTKT